jgi:hypothetical protein
MIAKSTVYRSPDSSESSANHTNDHSLTTVCRINFPAYVPIEIAHIISGYSLAIHTHLLTHTRTHAAHKIPPYHKDRRSTTAIYSLIWVSKPSETCVMGINIVHGDAFFWSTEAHVRIRHAEILAGKYVKSRY